MGLHLNHFITFFKIFFSKKLLSSDFLSMKQPVFFLILEFKNHST